MAGNPTPGPWLVYFDQASSAGDEKNLYVLENETDHYLKTHAANARLMSAAPDMLSALKGLIAAANHMSPFGSEASVKNIRLAGKYMEAVKVAETAIAKAEGK